MELATRIIEQEHVVPVVAVENAAHAGPLADALVAGGLHTVEITFRTSAASAVIRALADREDIAVGAGTVVRPDQVDEAVGCGARFVVGPGLSAAVVRRCQDHGLPVFPGVATASEVQSALELGVETVKFFPAEQAGGARMLTALAAPFRTVRFLPTGGVNAGNLAEYLRLPSVLAVGGTWLAGGGLITNERWDEITRLTAQAVAAVRAVRP
jgi:2-dehydro-3-deoxyphosphogluconate aldolase / (4S)-4-hydroxy-2-oxoglutarate aldolase